MNDKFDELAKAMAQSVTRRGALKKFGLGLAGMAVACLGLANKAQAGNTNKKYHCDCKQGYDFGCSARYGFGTDGTACIFYCDVHCGSGV